MSQSRCGLCSVPPREREREKYTCVRRTPRKNLIRCSTHQNVEGLLQFRNRIQNHCRLVVQASVHCVHDLRECQSSYLYCYCRRWWRHGRNLRGHAVRNFAFPWRRPPFSRFLRICDGLSEWSETPRAFGGAHADLLTRDSAPLRTCSSDLRKVVAVRRVT